MKSGFFLRPAWTFALVLLLVALIASAPAAVNALKRLLGYVPDVGLVENTGHLRMLAEPASVTRNGITITVTQAMVYEDRVELTYMVEGVGETYSNSSGVCGSYHPDNNFWSDADADLRLPNGTVIRRDYAGKYQFENRYAMKPVYAVNVPPNVTEMTMLLKCIPFTRLGEVPENWEIPFKLIAIPEGTIVGAPVIEVDVTSLPTTREPESTTSTLPLPQVTMTLERVGELDENTIFYLHFDVKDQNPSLISIMPASAYVIDSSGQKSQLRGNYVLQPFEHRVGSSFEFMSQTKLADGPVTIIIEDAVAIYAPLYTDPPQATPDEMSFTFEAGTDPQPGQSWSINKDFTIAGYPIRVLSARAATFEDIRTPDFIDGSQGFDYGYQFTLETDPSVKMLIWMDIMSESAQCWLSNATPFVPEHSSIQFTQLCRDEYPKGNIRVTIGELSTLLENSWQATWAP